MLRSLLITDPLIVLATILMGTLSLLVSLFDPQGVRQHRISRLWSRMLLSLGRVKVRVEGIDKIDPGAGYVFVANHCSYMDTPVVLAHIPSEFRFMAKKGLFLIPFLGTHLKSAGHVPVVRGDARASLKSMTEAAAIIRRRSLSILVFPEGGRTRQSALRAFKEGAAYIAIKAGAPIVPVGLVGTRAVLPMDSFHIRPGTVELRIGDPIPTRGMNLKQRGDLTQTVRNRVLELLGESVPKPQETR